MDDTGGSGRLIRLREVRRDDALIDVLATTPLDGDEIVEDGCDGALLRLCRSWRRDPEALCSCGHDGSAHEHFRPGSDCGRCRPGRDCSNFRPEPTRMGALLRRAGRIRGRRDPAPASPPPRSAARPPRSGARIDSGSSEGTARCAVERFVQARAHLDDVIAQLAQGGPAAPGSLNARIPAQRSDSRSVSGSIAAAIEALDLAYETWLRDDAGQQAGGTHHEHKVEV